MHQRMQKNKHMQGNDLDTSTSIHSLSRRRVLVHQEEALGLLSANYPSSLQYTCALVRGQCVEGVNYTVCREVISYGTTNAPPRWDSKQDFEPMIGF